MFEKIIEFHLLNPFALFVAASYLIIWFTSKK